MNSEADNLSLDLDDIIMARTDATLTEYYLDTETGDVLAITDEMEMVYRELEPHIEPDMELEEVRAVIDEHVEIEWMESVLLSRHRVVIDAEDRYIHIPFEGSREGYRDMVSFIETIEDDHLAELLTVAIDGKGAFRRFKDVLYNYPEERQRWFEYSRECQEQRARRWLRRVGLTAAEEGEDES